MLPVGPDLRGRPCLTAAAGTAFVSSIDPRLVSAPLIDEIRLALRGIHQSQIWCADEPLCRTLATGAARGQVPFLNRAEEHKVSAVPAGIIVNRHVREKRVQVKYESKTAGKRHRGGPRA